MKSILVVFIFFLASSEAESSQQVKINSLKPQFKKTSRFLHSLSWSFGTNLEKEKSSSKSYSTEMGYTLSYKLSPLYSASLGLKVRKKLKVTEGAKIEDTKIGLSKKRSTVIKKLQWSPSLSVVLPTNKKTRDIDRLKGGIEVNNSLLYSTNTLLQFNYVLRFVKNFHEYKTSESNKTNSQHKILQFFVGQLSFTESFYFETAFIYANSWSYEGTQRDPGYLTNLEFGYKWPQNINTALGSTQGGSIAKMERGRNKSISVFDSNETTVYARVGIIF